MGFGQSPSPALSQALARADAEYWREVLRARLEANGPIPAFICWRKAEGFLLAYVLDCLIMDLKFVCCLTAHLPHHIPFIRPQYSKSILNEWLICVRCAGGEAQGQVSPAFKEVAV